MPMRILSAVSLVVLLQACGNDSEDVADVTALCTVRQECNGAAELCDRRYDAVTYPTTHNAMSAGAEGWTHSYQRYGIARQLDDGIRALMLDVHDFGGEP